MANKITLLRIAALPLLVYLLQREGRLMSLLALLAFVALGVTDLLDGYVARRLGQVTGHGKLLDPIADKLLLMTAILPLIGRGAIPAWLGIVILGREFIVNGVRMIAASEHRIIAAGTWGKYKTIVYIVSVSFIIGAPVIPRLERPLILAGFAGLIFGVALAVVSAAEYFRYLPSGSTPSNTEAGK